MNGDGIRARRHAREVAGELRWQGMTVPSLYARMAVEFQDLVGSGDYAAWVAATQSGGRSGLARASRAARAQHGRRSSLAAPAVRPWGAQRKAATA